MRRYLLPFNPRQLPTTSTDVLVIGSGSAALIAAIEAADRARVLIVTKKESMDSGSSKAQGGIAAAISDRDTVIAHLDDTIKAGCGLTDAAVARLCVTEGMKRIRELIGWGISFDRDRDNRLAFAREGGHRMARILHKGDETGAELERTLLNRAKRSRSIAIRENTYVVDLLTSRDACLGALVHRPDGGLEIVRARKTILATGGLGQIYRETTNPSISTGDGIAMAWRAGAVVQDLEFVQFHPTTLYLAGASRTLVSEAVRGAGAVLRDKSGYAFMKDYHSMGDLAPRDVVSRSILRQIKITGDTQVYLDLSSMTDAYLRKRFPNLWDLCRRYRVDRSMVPVRPSAHYTIGGVKIDLWGRTNVRNLYACGECACSGFHGANRLGSNSLLECLVFGKRAGEDAAASLGRRTAAGAIPRADVRGIKNNREIDVDDMRNSLKSLMWRHAGIERDRNGLSTALEFMEFWSRYVVDGLFHTPDGWELQNMLTAARLVAASALKREESRGVHFRVDFPAPDDRRWKRHSTIDNRFGNKRIA